MHNMVKPKGGYTEYFKVLYRMIKKFIYDVPHFGIKIAHYNFWGEFANSGFLPFNLNKKVKQKRNKLINNFLESKYSKLIEKYKNKEFMPGKNSKKIRCLWWQGIENAPDIVKICVNSIQKHKSDYDIVFLDKDNYKKFITLPDFILKKVEDKTITITHLSDIIRMALLKEYGGVRIDATMYITKDIFDSFDDININSNYPDKYVKSVGGFEKWCGFFIGGRSNCKLFSFVYDFFIQYHKDYNQLINYFLIDYAIGLAYNNFIECKEDINNIILNNNEIFTFQQNFNEEYEKEKYDKLINNGFFKLSYKLEFNGYDKNGNLTNFGHFLKENSAH